MCVCVRVEGFSRNIQIMCAQNVEERKDFWWKPGAGIEHVEKLFSSYKKRLIQYGCSVVD